MTDETSPPAFLAPLRLVFPVLSSFPHFERDPHDPESLSLCAVKKCATHPAIFWGHGKGEGEQENVKGINSFALVCGFIGTGTRKGMILFAI
jgi:hypothetical protein